MKKEREIAKSNGDNENEESGQYQWRHENVMSKISASINDENNVA